MNTCRAAFIVFSLLLFGARFARTEERKEVFRLGVVQSLSGIAAEYGKGLTQIIQLASEDISAGSAVKIELIVEDDQTDPKKAVTAFQSLSMRKVDAIMGSSWDFVSNAIIPLAARSKTVLFNVSVMAEALDLNTGGGYAFTNAQSIDQEAEPLVTYLKDRPVKTATIAYANNRWGEEMLRAHRQVLAHAGVRILEEVKPSGLDANEWGALIPRFRAQSPDLILLLLNKSDIDNFLHRAREQKVSTLFYTTNNSFDALKQTNDKSLYQSVCFAYPFERLGRMKDVAQRYEAKYHEAPRWFADNAYDAVWLLHKAFLDSREHAVPLREALLRTEYQGIAGRYQFKEAQSFGLGGLSLACIKDGAVQAAKP